MTKQDVIDMLLFSGMSHEEAQERLALEVLKLKTLRTEKKIARLKAKLARPIKTPAYTRKYLRECKANPAYDAATLKYVERKVKAHEAKARRKLHNKLHGQTSGHDPKLLKAMVAQQALGELLKVAYPTESQRRQIRRLRSRIQELTEGR